MFVDLSATICHLILQDFTKLHYTICDDWDISYFKMNFSVAVTHKKTFVYRVNVTCIS